MFETGHCCSVDFKKSTKEEVILGIERRKYKTMVQRQKIEKDENKPAMPGVNIRIATLSIF